MAAEGSGFKELPEMGSKPFNPVRVTFITVIAGLDIQGYVVSMGKAILVQELVTAIAKDMDITEEALSLACEGKDLIREATIRDNGIVEPGPSARREGAKVELVLSLKLDYAPNETARAEEATAEAERLRLKEEQRRAAELERLRREEEQRKLEELAKRLPKERERDEPMDEVTRNYLVSLRQFLQRKSEAVELLTPATQTVTLLTEQQIRQTLRVHVADIDERIAPRSGDVPTIEFIVSTYNNGLPNYASPLKEHFACSLKHSLGVIREADMNNAFGASRRRALCQRLADAFEACQAVQARVIEQIAEELAEGPRFERDLRSMVVELRERTLDKVIMKIEKFDAEGLSDSGQMAHTMNSYRQALGVSRVNHHGADRLAQPLSDQKKAQAVDLFDKMIDILELTDAFVEDVNQPSTACFERRVDRDGLGEWAGSRETVMHRIHFDETRPHLYRGRAPLPQDKFYPFMHRGLAVEIMHMVFCETG